MTKALVNPLPNTTCVQRNDKIPNKGDKNIKENQGIFPCNKSDIPIYTTEMQNSKCFIVYLETVGYVECSCVIAIQRNLQDDEARECYNAC